MRLDAPARAGAAGKAAPQPRVGHHGHADGRPVLLGSRKPGRVRSARLTADLGGAVVTHRDLEVRSDPPFGASVGPLSRSPWWRQSWVICTPAAPLPAWSSPRGWFPPRAGPWASGCGSWPLGP